MFSFATALVPLIFPVGWGIGYAVTTGMKKVCDRFFPGKDGNKEYDQDEEDDLFWKGFPSRSKEQTDPAGEDCSEKALDVGTSDSISSSVQNSTEDDSTVSGQTDPAGEVCSETTVHREGETTVAEKSDLAGEDMSAADLTAKALVSLVPSLSLQKSPLKGTFSGSFEIQSSPDNSVAHLSNKPPLNVKISVAVDVSCSPEDNSAASVGSDLPDVGRTSAGQGQAEVNFFKFSDELQNSWVNAAFQSILNLNVTKRCLAQERVFLEASSIPCCGSLMVSAVRQPGKHFCQKDLSPVLMELREKKLPSGVGKDYDIKSLLESVLVWLDSFGGDTERELYDNDSCSNCGATSLRLLNNGALIALPPILFSTSISILLEYWLDVACERRCSGCGSPWQKKHCLANNQVLVFFLHRFTREYQTKVTQTIDVPAECGMETYHLSSVICGDPKLTDFYCYLMKGERTVKADNEHVFTADSDCSEDMSKNGFIYIYEKK
ncbi:PREDICTED: uncharacterized protein LOC106928805 [Poecilia mexicana]|uniref:uncharacterized protein LOC106928805 n=1 Tax=Poecilia mexicana TaxID=48701 RepID=UPI00072EAD46|nr:PREDICTED: uncharacterized protein LOC106928805 [Poecilia mexicana]XP_014860908.1 PREDICTED: uncharacterized protein LOC106928805 [Poecilia mexicana]